MVHVSDIETNKQHFTALGKEILRTALELEPVLDSELPVQSYSSSADAC